ncbi:hypothetical protein D3C81_1403080 [compost metagenome]
MAPDETLAACPPPVPCGTLPSAPPNSKGAYRLSSLHTAQFLKEHNRFGFLAEEDARKRNADDIISFPGQASESLLTAPAALISQPHWHPPEGSAHDEFSIDSLSMQNHLATAAALLWLSCVNLSCPYCLPAYYDYDNTILTAEWHPLAASRHQGPFLIAWTKVSCNPL